LSKKEIFPQTHKILDVFDAESGSNMKIEESELWNYNSAY